MSLQETPRGTKSPLQWLDAIKEAATQLAPQLAEFRVRELPAALTYTFEAESMPPPDGSIELHLNLEAKRALRELYPGCKPEVTVTISRKDTGVTVTVTLVHV